MIEGIKLYGYWRSSCTWRVRIGLGLKGLAYETVPVHLLADGGGQNAPDFEPINPLGQVPVLEWTQDGQAHRLTQSLAILRFLDAVQPEPPLEPASPLQRARAWEAAELINAGIQPLQNLRMLQQIDAWGGDRKEFGASMMRRGFVGLERLLARSAGRYAIGDSPTIVDACLVPQLYNARRFGVELQPFPTLTRVEGTCAENPVFRAARPEVQADAEETT